MAENLEDLPQPNFWQVQEALCQDESWKVLAAAPAPDGQAVAALHHSSRAILEVVVVFSASSHQQLGISWQDDVRAASRTVEMEAERMWAEHNSSELADTPGR